MIIKLYGMYHDGFRIIDNIDEANFHVKAVSFETDSSSCTERQIEEHMRNKGVPYSTDGYQIFDLAGVLEFPEDLKEKYYYNNPVISYKLLSYYKFERFPEPFRNRIGAYFPKVYTFNNGFILNNEGKTIEHI